MGLLNRLTDMFALLTLCVLLVPPVWLQTDVGCKDEGVYKAFGRNYTVCSRNDDGTLTLKFGDCGPSSAFSLEEKRCLPTSSLVEPRSQPGTKWCFNEGSFCRDCNTLDHCWKVDNYFKRTTETCKTYETCSAYENRCISRRDKVIPQCEEDYEFTCQYSGLVPDPYHCNVYYFCELSGSKPVILICPPKEYYDPLYQQCVRYVDDVQPPCPPTNECTKHGSQFAVKRNPNIYYRCSMRDYYPLTFDKTMHRCPRDLVFNGTDCVKKNYYKEDSKDGLCPCPQGDAVDRVTCVETGSDVQCFYDGGLSSVVDIYNQISYN